MKRESILKRLLKRCRALFGRLVGRQEARISGKQEATEPEGTCPDCGGVGYVSYPENPCGTCRR